MKKLISITLLLCLSFLGKATLVRPPSLKEQLNEQLKDADAVVHGIYRGSKGSKRTARGAIITTHSLEIMGVAGLNQHKIVNKKNYKFITPGGKWQQIVQHSKDMPQFKVGEEIVLFLHSTSNGYSINKRNFVKYNIITKRRAKYLINTVSSADKKLSAVSFEEFNSDIKRKFGQSLTKKEGRNKLVYTPPTSAQGRGPASISSPTTEHLAKKKTSFYYLWPLFVLGVIGMYFKRQGT